MAKRSKKSTVDEQKRGNSSRERIKLKSLLLLDIGVAAELAKQESKVWTFSLGKCTLERDKGTVPR